MNSIENNLAQVRLRLSKSTQSANREPDSVTLMAVSKTKPIDDIVAAFNAGQRDFGENYLQEALEKIENLHKLEITWHYIGAVQSNKTRDIAEHFDWVHTVDRLKIADFLNRHRPSSLPPLQVCLQVNIDDEESKSGCRREELVDLAKAVSTLPNLRLRGLMAIPRPNSGAKPFLELAGLMQAVNQSLNLELDTLSMGMSDDLELAVDAGATVVRVGTAIFGTRSSAE